MEVFPFLICLEFDYVSCHCIALKRQDGTYDSIWVIAVAFRKLKQKTNHFQFKVYFNGKNPTFFPIYYAPFKMASVTISPLILSSLISKAPNS